MKLTESKNVWIVNYGDRYFGYSGHKRFNTEKRAIEYYNELQIKSERHPNFKKIPISIMKYDVREIISNKE